MKFKNILAEQLMLMEDVAKAEKILKIIQVPLDDPDYVAFKQRLAADNNPYSINSIEKSILDVG